MALNIDPEATANFDHFVFDTAPTGHTLRLMTLPQAWTGSLITITTGSSCLGPLTGLQKEREINENAVAALADGQRMTLVPVSRAQKAALTEAERTSGELALIGVRNQRLIPRRSSRFAESPWAGLGCSVAEAWRAARAVRAAPGRVVAADATVLPRFWGQSLVLCVGE